MYLVNVDDALAKEETFIDNQHQSTSEFALLSFTCKLVTCPKGADIE